MWILDLLLKSREPKPTLATQILGCFFLMLAVMVGAYFLFQALAPQLGYLESGGVICGLLSILGIFLLFIKQKRSPSLQEETLQKILTVVKNFDIEKTLKDNALTLSLLSLGIGILLSQIKDPKKLSAIYRMFK